MAFALMVVKNWKSGDADIGDLCAQFKLAVTDVDGNFGLIGNMGSQNVVTDYTVMIDEGQVGRLKQDYPGQFEGPFSNPGIATFAPVNPSF